MRRNLNRWLQGALVSCAVMGSALPMTAQAQGAGAPAPPPGKVAPPVTKPKPAKPLTPAQKQEEAGRLFKEGKAKYDAGDFQGAYDSYKLADDLVPDPPVPKYAMAQCLDKMGKVDDAIKMYEAFLAGKTRPDKDEKRIVDAKSRIEALKVAPADVTVVLAPPEAAAAKLTLDGQPVTSPLKAAPGKHILIASLDGFEDSKTEFEVTRGEKKELTLTLTAKPGGTVVDPDKVPDDKKPPPTEKPVPAEPSSGSSLVPAIVTLSLAGAGVVVGGVFGGLALASQSDYEAGPTEDLFNETERNALIADMAFGVGLTFGVTGLVLLLTDSGEEEAKPEEKKDEKAARGFVAPFFTPQGGGAVGVVTF